MKPAVGLYVRDNNMNTYRIVDESGLNTHSGNMESLQVECIEGPNLGKIRWVGYSTIVQGNFPVTKE
jgi:hypothetical protein